MTILFAGFAFGRMVGMAIDGPPVPLHLGVLAFEGTFAAIALAALRQDTRDAHR